MIRGLLLSVCILLCSCQAFHVSEILDTAERQIVEYPDSALTTMRSIRRYAVLVPQVRARYGVLYSAALDKNYIDVASDSLVRYSADYYDLHGTPEQRMQAYYYLGRTQQNAGEDLSATLSFLDAAQYTDTVDNNYLKGLLYSQLGEMYSRYNRILKASQYYEKSYNYYKEANLPQHQAYQLYEMGVMQLGLQNIDRAIELFGQSRELADSSNFTNIRKFILSMTACAYNGKEDYQGSYKVLKECESLFSKDEIYTYTDICGVAANIYAHRGDKKLSRYYLDKGWSLANRHIDTITMRYYQSKCLIIEQQITKGYKAYSAVLYEDLLARINDVSNNPIDDAQSLILTQKNAELEEKAYKLKIFYIAISALFIIIFVAIVVYIRRWYNRKMVNKNMEITAYLAVIDELRDSVHNQSQDIFSLNNENLKNKFEMINSLCTTYYEHDNQNRQQDFVFRQVKMLIDEISSGGEYFTVIEGMTNRHRDNILQRLKEEILSISDDEYKLACYLCAGFSTQAICLFFGCTKEVLYRRTYRLREKIKKSNSTNKDNYLLYI